MLSGENLLLRSRNSRYPLPTYYTQTAAHWIAAPQYKPQFVES